MVGYALPLICVVRVEVEQSGGPSAALAAVPVQSHAFAFAAAVQSLGVGSVNVHAYWRSIAAVDVSVFHSRPFSGSVPRLYVVPGAWSVARGAVDSIMCGSMPSRM